MCLRLYTVAVLFVCLVFRASCAEITNTVAPSTNAVAAQTNDAQQRLYLKLQEQLHSALLAIEQNRQEAESTSRRNAETISAQLKLVEQALDTQRESQIEAVQSSNRVLLIITAAFACLGLLALFLGSFFQFRTMNRMAEIASAFSGVRPLASSPVLPWEAEEKQLLGGNQLEQSTTRLLGAIERLEKRVHELEHNTRPALTGGNDESSLSDRGIGEDFKSLPKAEQISLLLGKGQALLNLNKAGEATVCFDRVLALDPSHAEALVKKGTALERMKKLEEAIECYDRAIAANNSMTLAYLYKGGVFNQLERFSEALQCYEQALRTQQKATSQV